MFRNNLVIIFMTIALLGINAEKGYSISAIPQKDTDVNLSSEINNLNPEETEIINRVSFRDKFRKSPEAQINSFFKKYNKYSEKNDIEKLKSLYSDDFINNDGFNKETIFTMTKQASGAYKNIKYTTLIENMKITGNYAVVKIRETAIGETEKVIDKFHDNGSVKSEIYYIDYLKKEGNDWKIANSEVMEEQIELKYGEAKNTVIELTGPDCVSEGSEYEAVMNTKTPDGVFLVGSITNEPIVFPQVQSKDIFRPIKNESLARVLKANKDGKNEYVTASLAITRAQVEPTSVVINMTGMAFSMKRINVFQMNNKKIKEEIDAAQH